MQGFYTKFRTMTFTGKIRIEILEDGYRSGKQHPRFTNEAKADTYIAKIEKEPLNEAQRAQIINNAEFKRDHIGMHSLTTTQHAMLRGEI